LRGGLGVTAAGLLPGGGNIPSFITGDEPSKLPPTFANVYKKFTFDDSPSYNTGGELAG
jgi:hypothetical protein